MALITKPTALSKIWATTGVKEAPADSKIAQGWVVELPPYQFDNWLNNKQDTFIAHVNQFGIPTWDAETDYQGGKSYVQGSDGVVYKAILTNSNVVPSNPLNSATWTKAFEDFGSVAALTITVNNLATDYSTLANIANTAAARTNLSVFSKTESDARFAPVAGNAAQTFSVANATLDSHAINRGQFNALLNTATEVQAGILEVATQSEVNVGTLDNVAVTPLKLKAAYTTKAEAATLVPVGAIIMWSGVSVPAGWKLCDGTGTISNGLSVPDLRGRFVIGSGGEYTTGQTGGGNTFSINGSTDSHTLTLNQIPSHSHAVNPKIGAADGGNGYNWGWNDVFGGNSLRSTTDAGGNQGHSHTLSLAGTVALPPYYALAYIIKN